MNGKYPVVGLGNENVKEFDNDKYAILGSNKDSIGWNLNTQGIIQDSSKYLQVIRQNGLIKGDDKNFKQYPKVRLPHIPPVVDCIVDTQASRFGIKINGRFLGFIDYEIEGKELYFMLSFDGARPPSSVILRQHSKGIMSLKEMCKVSIINNCKIASWRNDENLPNCLKRYLKASN